PPAGPGGEQAPGIDRGRETGTEMADDRPVAVADVARLPGLAPGDEVGRAGVELAFPPVGPEPAGAGAAGLRRSRTPGGAPEGRQTRGGHCRNRLAAAGAGAPGRTAMSSH